MIAKNSAEPIKSIRVKIAMAFVGRLVLLRIDAKRFAHGIVTAVLTEAGTPKVVVDGNPNDLVKILTARPLSLN